ncbi:LLM class F420-dependent oxidoreductase [Mycobacterium paraterrae]|uniref:LLM class F420-dependent oxidoreductase n=1 Tax=Mycobacterium paraterrae TaxID=577492 RepID=A0ABY3VSD8_9MYCO|nr:LLM class F420-dependent oxidoreductase [Mycobacterium paraterrae]UMB71002.1 LLM class F420-dependent oxidoreductase [Mycobacterium paraterrae]
MRLGIFTFFNDTGIRPAELAVELETRGFASLFTTEHMHMPVHVTTPYRMGGPIPAQYYRTVDQLVALTAAATATTSLGIGTGITLVAQHDPILLAKQLASLDMVSDGRLLFGAGVGWLREEIANHGVDPRSRGRVFDEKLAAIVEIWTHDEAEYHGEYVDFDPIYSWPKPVTTPHPPIYLGGGTAAFGRIAKLGAGWLPNSTGAQHLSEPLTQLRNLAADTRVIVQHIGSIPDTTELQRYYELGIDELLVELPTQPRDGSLRHLDAVTHQWTQAH